MTLDYRGCVPYPTHPLDRPLVIIVNISVNMFSTFNSLYVLHFKESLEWFGIFYRPQSLGCRGRKYSQLFARFNTSLLSRNFINLHENAHFTRKIFEFHELLSKTYYECCRNQKIYSLNKNCQF